MRKGIHRSVESHPTERGVIDSGSSWAVGLLVQHRLVQLVHRRSQMAALGPFSANTFFRAFQGVNTYRDPLIRSPTDNYEYHPPSEGALEAYNLVGKKRRSNGPNYPRSDPSISYAIARADISLIDCCGKNTPNDRGMGSRRLRIIEPSTCSTMEPESFKVVGKAICKRDETKPIEEQINSHEISLLDKRPCWNCWFIRFQERRELFFFL